MPRAAPRPRCTMCRWTAAMPARAPVRSRGRHCSTRWTRLSRGIPSSSETAHTRDAASSGRAARTRPQPRRCLLWHWNGPHLRRIWNVAASRRRLLAAGKLGRRHRPHRRLHASRLCTSPKKVPTTPLAHRRPAHSAHGALLPPARRILRICRPKIHPKIPPHGNCRPSVTPISAPQFTAVTNAPLPSEL